MKNNNNNNKEILVKCYLTGRQKMGDEKGGSCGKGKVQMKEIKGQQMKNGKWMAGSQHF